MNEKVIKDCIKTMLIELGENPEREGLKETPDRVYRMLVEVFEGIKYSNDDIVRMFGKTFKAPSSSLIIEKDIECFSWCEHHMALIYNMKISVAYVPCETIIGLSKIARIVDLVCKRLQVQERITEDISYIMRKILKTNDVAVFVEAEHSCMTARGIKKPGTKTRTVSFKGIFKENSIELKELLERIK